MSRGSIFHLILTVNCCLSAWLTGSPRALVWGRSCSSLHCLGLALINTVQRFSSNIRLIYTLSCCFLEMEGNYFHFTDKKVTTKDTEDNSFCSFQKTWILCVQINALNFHRNQAQGLGDKTITTELPISYEEGCFKKSQKIQYHF